MRKKVGAIAIKRFALLVVLGTAYQAMAQEAKTLYPSMAPIEQYLMDRTFVCIVERSWTSAADTDFWNPKVRTPICYNPAAARSLLPRNLKRTDMILAGRTKSQVDEAIVAAVDKKELPAMEPGAMCYMMSKQGYGGDSVAHWPSTSCFSSRSSTPQPGERTCRARPSLP